ncbi:hypothetical protein AB0R12_20230 [Streptomyces niveus]
MGKHGTMEWLPGKGLGPCGPGRSRCRCPVRRRR